jgi:hypothetical protein
LQIQKNTGAPAAKTASMLKTQPQIKPSAPQAVSQTVHIQRSITSLISSLNLPQDKLSANLLSFARFFSLPFKPELMAEIRRQVFTPQAELIKQTTAEKPADTAADKIRSALLLAAAAAESKGVELSPKGLEYFAETIDPEREGGQGDGQNKDKQNKNQDKQEEYEEINGIILQKKACESEENNPLLSIMNKLPGKDGKRWVVNSFEFNKGDSNFRVSMRILLEPEQIREQAQFLALDIVETGKLFNRSSFVMESVNNRIKKLIIFSQSELAPSKISVLKKELSKLLEIPVESVFVKTSDETFPFESGFGEENMYSIDEEC